MRRRAVLNITGSQPQPEITVLFSQLRSGSDDKYCIGYTDISGNEVDFPYTTSRTREKKPVYTPSELGLTPILTDEIQSIKTSIKYLEYPPSVTEMAFDFDSTFTSHSIKAVVFPDNFRKIKSYAFQRSKLNDMSVIPASVIEIGTDRPFENCPVTEFRMDENNSNYCVQDGVIFNKAKTKILHYPCGSPRTSYQVPDSVKTIGLYTFSMVANIKEIIIPQSVTNLERYVFNNTNFERLVVKATAVPITERDTFNGFKGKQIVVPKGCLDAYKTAQYWSSFASIMTEEE